MKKNFKIISVILLVIVSINVFFYVRYLNLDTYTWNTDGTLLILGEKQYKCEPLDNSVDLNLDKQIGKIQDEDSSFRVCSIKGESINDRIAIRGFMFPAEAYSRIDTYIKK
ncbi:hypothetical protein [Romboutsia lituseburensis]|uniref:hypothetical protein n=1 Tax=Romboutsia lituseburensis TaxID=1537 RepID=UPI00215A65FA|nr:hypothetical protein [Romboutsia lituseburensis]MCR8743709.1 hypothetical protein [Romboutsia lituseburensis]